MLSDYIKRYGLPFFISLLQISILHSQTPPYYHYSSEDGLPSSTVYEMLQDRNGYIWFATANGISRFDGSTFKNFTTKDGLNSNSIKTILEGNDGEIIADCLLAN